MTEHIRPDVVQVLVEHHRRFLRFPRAPRGQPRGRKCGMALEPEAPAIEDEGPGPELVDMTRRLGSPRPHGSGAGAGNGGDDRAGAGGVADAERQRVDPARADGSVRARRLSRATRRNIRQDLVWAFLYNALGVPVAAGVLYPVFGLLLSPMLAGAAIGLSAVSVIANALRLRGVRL
jgi:hypothetical protein